MAQDSKSELIFVAISCIHHCYDKVSDQIWMGYGVKAKRSSKATKPNASLPETPTPIYEGPITRSKNRKLIKNSEM